MGARESLNGRENMTRRIVKNGEESFSGSPRMTCAVIVVRLHQERITLDRNHPEGAGESTVKMKSHFFSVNHLY